MKSWGNLPTWRLKMTMKHRKKDTHGEDPVKKLLQPIKNLDLDDESDISEISDIFEEFHKNSYLRPQDKHYLTKHEADVKTIEDFTGDFKKTMATLRQDLQVGDQLLLENVDKIPEIFEHSKNFQVFPKISINTTITKMLDDTTSTIPPIEDTRKPSDASSASIIWHLLEANSDNKKFEISPPNYDTFRQEQPHWLQRASVSWEEIDRAKLKCETWLQQQTF